MTLLVAMVLVACDTPAPAPPAIEQVPAASVAAAPGEAPLDGKALYDRYCVGCHQPDGTGMGGRMAPDFTTDRAVLTQDDATLLASMRDGLSGPIGNMPAWKTTLTDEQLMKVLAYMRTF